MRGLHVKQAAGSRLGQAACGPGWPDWVGQARLGSSPGRGREIDRPWRQADQPAVGGTIRDGRTQSFLFVTLPGTLELGLLAPTRVEESAELPGVSRLPAVALPLPIDAHPATVASSQVYPRII